jgi:hypothetical protein
MPDYSLIMQTEFYIFSLYETEHYNTLHYLESE